MGGSPNISRTELDASAPVVVVGQARSGSTLATWLLNHGGGLVVNDAYVAQIAEGMGAPGPFGGGRAAALPGFRAAALARLRLRSVEGGEPPIHRPTVTSPAMRRAAEAAEGEDWARLWGAMLHGAAEAGGRAFWGWNTPPDWTRAEEILAAFPRARFVFVSRGLWAVLRSYKALPEHWGRERARWHPALQARAWAAVARGEARLRAAAPGRVHRLDYEALTAAPEATLAAVARFLGVEPFSADPAALERNASGPGARLSRAEIWAARAALGPAGRASAGPAPAPEGLGLGALATATGRAGAFYLGAAWRSPDMRGRLWRMARA